MKRKTVMRCTATILASLLMLLTTISVFAVEKFDRKNFSDPKKFRIKATGVGSFYSDKGEDENSFGTLSVRYVIPFEYTPYYAGCVALAAAVLLIILEKKNKKEVTQ